VPISRRILFVTTCTKPTFGSVTFPILTVFEEFQDIASYGTSLAKDYLRKKISRKGSESSEDRSRIAGGDGSSDHDAMGRQSIRGFEQALISIANPFPTETFSMFVSWIGTWPATVTAETPIGLAHIDSELCWCDPIAEPDEHGHRIVLHKEVTWH
jgi:hypothetical protein